MLNARGALTDFGRPWTRRTVHQVLTNEKYVGNNVYNRVSFKLKNKRVVNPHEIWARSNGVFEPIGSVDLFSRARSITIAVRMCADNREPLDYYLLLSPGDDLRETNAG